MLITMIQHIGGSSGRAALAPFLWLLLASHGVSTTLAQSTSSSGSGGTDNQNVVDGGSFTYYSAPKEINVEAKLSYDKKFMALMNSPCRPEHDGYFGSTYGHYPYLVKFGFQIETVPNSKLTEVITTIDDYIVDEILTNVYPAMCGYRRRNRNLADGSDNSGRAGGFHFGQILELPREECDMTGVRNPIDFCAVFSGEIKVYGHNQKEATYQVLEYINTVLNKDDPGRMHPDLIRMKSLSNLEKVIPLKNEIRHHPGSGKADDDHDGYLSGNGPLGISRIAWAGFSLAVLFIGIGLCWLVMDRRKRAKLMFSDNSTIGYSTNTLRRPRRRGGGNRGMGRSGTTGLFSSNFFLRFNNNNKKWLSKNAAFGGHDPYYDNPLEEQSIRHSPEADETVDLGAGNMLLLNEDGRPVEIDYDEYRSNSSASGSGSGNSDRGDEVVDDDEIGAHSSMLPIDRSEGII